MSWGICFLLHLLAATITAFMPLIRSSFGGTDTFRPERQSRSVRLPPNEQVQDAE
jgi:hypothetical protein